MRSIMAKQTKPDPDVTQTLRALALRYPEAQQGIACQGTALQSISFKARDKAFLFISGAGPAYTIRLKLGQSQAEATQLAAQEPGRYQLGAHGWATVKFTADKPPPVDLMARWIAESYRLLADKKLVALLAGAQASATSAPSSGLG